MRLDLGTLAFGYQIRKGGGTPNWATSLGQGKEYKINNDEEINELLKGLVYSSVSLEYIMTKIGKGGNMVKGNDANSPIILASLFSTVYVNGTLIPGGKFILLITKDRSKSHKGRLRLKYGPSNTYKNEFTQFDNKNFYELFQRVTGLANNACWFVTEINVKNQNELHLKAVIVNKNGSEEYEDSQKLHEAWENLSSENLNASLNLKGYNKIYYGIPGCGKSYYVENTILKDVDKEDVFRTTFYLDYSNSDFIGQIYPVVKDENVTYEPIPGPFTKALERALTNKDHMVYLVIEEINRGNAAAIFGDVFQLLDRLKVNDEVNGRLAGSSEYPISNTFIEGYLEQQGVDFVKGQIVIPNNLTILATMNTSDQNVFPLDTAFKRRWDRKRVSVPWEKVGSIKKRYVPYTNITWQAFAEAINSMILDNDSNSDVSISEDKQMGPYFVQESMLTENPNEEDKDALTSFTGNVVDYLFTDVTKFDHSVLFDSAYKSYDRLYKQISENPIVDISEEPNVGPFAVFKDAVYEKSKEEQTKIEENEQRNTD